MELPLLALEVIASKKEIVPSVLVLDAMAPETKALKQEEIVVPTLEPVIPISERCKSVVEDPLPGENATPQVETNVHSTKVEGLLPGESVVGESATPETEVAIPTTTPEVTTPTTIAGPASPT